MFRFNAMKLRHMAFSLCLLVPGWATKSTAQEATNWSGPYVGGIAGISLERVGALNWSEADAATVGAGWGSCYGPGSCPHSLAGERDTAVLAGLQAGYNFALSRLVLGVETEFQGRSGAVTSGLAPIVAPGMYVEQTYSQRAEWIASVRGRVGGLLTPEVLVYGTAGVALGEIQRKYAADVYNGGMLVASTSGSASGTQAGWAAGAGVEWAVLKNVTVGLEYLHIDLGSDSAFGSRGSSGWCLMGTCNFIVNSGSFSEDSVRLKLNFKL